MDVPVDLSIPGRAAVAQTTSTELTEARHRLERFAKTIGTCEGQNREELRRWIENLDHAHDWTQPNDPLFLQMAASLAQGTLAKQLTFFKNEVGETSDEFTCENLKVSLRRCFLEENEGEYLRRQVAIIAQCPYEDSREFSRRFIDAMRKAYTSEEQKIK